MSFFKKSKKRASFFFLKPPANRFGSTFRPLYYLNISQFLGVINDNAFKFLIIFLFIDLWGIAYSNQVLFWAGTIYVLPFLLFSSMAGVLADRFSKKKIIVFLKLSEVVIMLLGIFAFIFKSNWGSYFLLFLLSLQSAIFGPPKYSIIPELIKSSRKIPKANGLITSFTYLGIIIGTFLASFLTQITNRNFPLTAMVCFVIALVGFLASLLIPYTPPKGSKKKINPLFFQEIYRNLCHAKKFPYLFVAILGSASFLFIGAYYQLNVIPFAVQTLHLSEVEGGYLFLLSAIGIACGALSAGYISHKRIEIGLACLSGVALALVLFFISLFSYLPFILGALFALGFFGGLYVVPFDSYIQTHSPEKKRGQIIAVSNFLSFCGVLIAPFLLYLFGVILDLSAAQGFTIMSVFILLMVFLISIRFFGYFLSSMAHFFICPFFKLKGEIPSCNFLICQENKKRLIFFLAAKVPRLHFIFVIRERKWYHLLFNLFSSVDFFSTKALASHHMALLVKGIEKKIQEKMMPCLVFENPSFLGEKNIFNMLKAFQNHAFIKSQFIKMKKGKKREITILFSDQNFIKNFER